MKKLYLQSCVSVMLMMMCSESRGMAQAGTASSTAGMGAQVSVMLDAPVPQAELMAELQVGQSGTAPVQPASTSTTTSTSSTTSSSTSTTQGAGTNAQTSPAKPRVTTEEELKAEEHQRIAGVLPAFNVEYDPTAPPLSPRQKFSLMWHTNTDYIVIATAAIDAGLSEAQDDFQGYGWGPQGYAKRFGASYADTFDGSLIGNAILPILLHQDPRYFRMGKGTFKHRLFYVISTTVICKSDSGKWEPNYSNVLGNFIAGGISNAYYPSSDRGLSLTLTRALTVTAEGTIGGTLNEFWPDIQKHLRRKNKQ